MLDLFLKLIDRCIDLAKRREQSNKQFYTDFIAPIYSDFEAVHKNYMDSFLKYREMISDRSLKLENNHPVIDLIFRDSLFSDNLRSKIAIFSCDIKTLSYDAAKPFVQGFVKAIAVYLGNAVVNELKFYRELEPVNMDIKSINEMLFHISIVCGIRHSFREELVKVLKESTAQEAKRKRAIRILDSFVATTQVNYMAVLREHNILKNKLLSPK